jgi:Arc/MetJ-type ribon-helix-helix transcriptional regulator
MKSKRTTISMPDALWEIAERRAEEDHYPSVTGYLQYLIREDDRKRRDQAAASVTPAASRRIAPHIKPRQGN